MKWGLAGLLAVSIAAMVVGVQWNTFAIHVFGLMFAALMTIQACLAKNIAFWGARRQVELACEAAIDNAQFMALIYLWGAAAVLAIYRLTPLDWRHDWQYATGMALIAGALLTYAQRLRTPGSRLSARLGLRTALVLTVLQAIAASAGLVYLAALGKLATVKDDWAASQIFLAGGLTVTALSVIAIITQVRLARARSDT